MTLDDEFGARNIHLVKAFRRDADDRALPSLKAMTRSGLSASTILQPP
jgi:hypothetical protein